MPQMTFTPAGIGPGGTQGISALEMPSGFDTANYANQQKLANIAANAQMYPATLQQQRFQQVFPWLENQTGGPAPGGLPKAPTISTNPVLNSQQIQQQVNTQNANSDQSTATQNKAMQAGLAGRGVGAQSPLAQALTGAAQGQNLASKTANETQTRLGAATTNAQQVLQEQQAQQQQYQQNQQLLINQQAPYYARQNALLAAISGLV
jgi:hypothetical protein